MGTDRRTLWQVIDRGAVRKSGIVVLFLLVWTLCVSIPLLCLGVTGRLLVLLLTGGVVSPEQMLPTSDTLMSMYVVTVSATALLGLVLVAVPMRRPEWRYLSRLGAIHVRSSQYPATHQALVEMSLAAGLSSPPALFVIPDDVSINAIVLGRGPRSATVAVTRGLALRTEARLQRAVLASLLSRFRSGGVGWTSFLFMLVSPIHAVVDRVRVSPLRLATGVAFLLLFSMLPLVWTMEYQAIGPTIGIPLAVIAVLWLAVSLGTVFAALHVVSAVVERSNRRAHAELALDSDARGVLLLKDPGDLLGALRAVLGQHSSVSGGRRFSHLSFVDCQRTASSDLCDLERRRLAQLEELVFPDRGQMLEPMRIGPLGMEGDRGGP